MKAEIKYINYCPVKSLSFQDIKSCSINKNYGMPNDRIFAFSRGIENNLAKSIEENPKDLIILLSNQAMKVINAIANITPGIA